MTNFQRDTMVGFLDSYFAQLRQQLTRWKTARQEFSVADELPLRTRNALIDAGFLAITSSTTRISEHRSSRDFGRHYVTRPAVSGGVTLVPTRKAVDWWVAHGCP